MFNSRLSSKPAVPDALADRARDARTAASQTAQTAAQSAAHAAQAAAQSAAHTAQSAAQSAAQEMGKSMRQGVYVARGWAAPRLEDAADYCTTTVAPRVADTLRSTARQVSPDDSKRKSGLRSAMSLSLLALAAAAAAGAVAVLVRRQYKAAMEADTETEVVDVDDANEPGAAVPGQPATPSPASTTNAGVNGQPSTSSW